MESILVSAIDLGGQEILASMSWFGEEKKQGKEKWVTEKHCFPKPASETHPLRPQWLCRLRNSRGDGSTEPGTMNDKEKHHVTTEKSMA